MSSNTTTYLWAVLGEVRVPKGGAAGEAESGQPSLRLPRLSVLLLLRSSPLLLSGDLSFRRGRGEPPTLSRSSGCASVPKALSGLAALRVTEGVAGRPFPLRVSFPSRAGLSRVKGRPDKLALARD